MTVMAIKEWCVVTLNKSEQVGISAYFLNYTMSLNVKFELLAFLLHVLDVVVSNVGSEIGCSDFIIILLSTSRHIPEWVLKLGHQRFLSYPFQFIAY